MSTTQEIRLTLTIEEANLILESLGQQPFVKVHQLIAKIQQQASGQLNVAPPASDKDE